MEGIFSDFHSPNGGVRFTIDTPRNIKKYPNTKLNMEPKNDATPRVNGFRLRKPQQLGGLDPWFSWIPFEGMKSASSR